MILLLGPPRLTSCCAHIELRRQPRAGRQAAVADLALDEIRGLHPEGIRVVGPDDRSHVVPVVHESRPLALVESVHASNLSKAASSSGSTRRRPTSLS